MKKWILLLIVCFLVGCENQKIEQEQNITVVASFYPVYILAKNITDGVEGITLQNMAQPQTGCLHDYQLTTKDRKALEKADLLLINGAGMESFLEGVKRQYNNLPIIDTSFGTELLCVEHEHHHHEEQEEAEEYNGHIWLSTENALKQAENICNALCEKDSKNKQKYYNNLEQFCKQLETFQKEQNEIAKGQNVVVFHEGFDYIAKEYGFHICGEVLVEEEKTPSAKELAHIIEEAKQQNVKLFFAADDEGKKYAELIAKEVGGKVYILNSITSGELEKDAYIKAIEQNRQMIQEAMGL